MNIAGRSVLHHFCREHPEVRVWVECWLSEVEEAQWRTKEEVLERYASASAGEHNHVRFVIGNTSYSILVLVAYRSGGVVVKRVGRSADT
jgi:mRNA-degrading endonuclease HigB of HigAB toxin-antitoxin module